MKVKDKAGMDVHQAKERVIGELHPLGESIMKQWSSLTQAQNPYRDDFFHVREYLATAAETCAGPTPKPRAPTAISSSAG